MSAIYSLEPPTRGKVVLQTTLGPIEIELWAKEAPKTVRNFVQHCVDGFYNNTLFHRLVRGFVLQGGDPTGTGEGGESIYAGGAPFAGEFHPRLRFSHRGIVAMAGRDKDDNRSQFFITLDRCDELDGGRHPIFGKVVGDTIFNVLEANALELVPGTERPVIPPRINSVDVVWNPFDDIVPRKLPTPSQQQQSRKGEAEARRQMRPGVVASAKKHDVTLLSFGEEELEAASSERISLRQPVPTIPTAVSAPAPVPVAKTETADEFDKRMREQLLKKRKRVEKAPPAMPQSSPPPLPPPPSVSSVAETTEPTPSLGGLRVGKLRLKDEPQQPAPAPPEGQQQQQPQQQQPQQQEQQEQKQEQKRRRKASAEDEEAVLARLERIRKLVTKSEGESSSWMAHRLVFEKQPRSVDPMAREDSEYISYDPRLHPPTATHDRPR